MQTGFKCLRRFAGLAVLGLALQACALAAVGTEPAPVVYVLNTPDIVLDASGPDIPVQLVIDKPDAPAAIDTNRIVFQPSSNEIQYFADARWSDRAPKLVQLLLVDALDKSGKFDAVGRKGEGIRADYEVRSTLLNFSAGPQPEGDGSLARVQLSVKLLRRPDDMIIAGRRFEVTVDASGSGTLSIINSFDAATGALLNDASKWLYSEIEEDLTGRS